VIVINNHLSITGQRLLAVAAPAALCFPQGGELVGPQAMSHEGPPDALVYAAIGADFLAVGVAVASLALADLVAPSLIAYPLL
jgi:hypothetical protein